jgi:hypothetical protein
MVLCLGCGRGEPTARLVGQVTIGGQPPAVPVMVVVEDSGRGISAAAAVDPSGRFDVLTAPGRGLPAGRYRLALIPTPPPIEDLDASLGPEPPPPAAPCPIPEQFQSPATSGLSVEVTLPETRFDIAVPRSK